DGSKGTMWNTVWTPWGSPHAITGTASLDARFPGQWIQVESGLHYNWHRHYDPSTGRYTQPDPLGFVDGPGVYQYAKGPQGMMVDPTVRLGSTDHHGWRHNASAQFGRDYVNVLTGATYHPSSAEWRSWRYRRREGA
ncbi:RHS repeat-associated core domain-containing protein, partial [Microbacteriaceae bacterium K1510]|nr:RHS repeat-associated core domain-containing protein [Microbacteriaceae bacterium K1510]